MEGSKNIRDVFNKVVGKAEQTKVDDFEDTLTNELPDWYHQGTKFLEEEITEQVQNAVLEPESEDPEEFGEL